MSIAYTRQCATFTGVVGVNDAEVLLEWLQEHRGGGVDLTACTHLHPANLQVLMTARPAIQGWPEDRDLAGWLRSALEGLG